MQNKKIVSSDLASKIGNLNIFQAILGQNSVHLASAPNKKGANYPSPSLPNNSRSSISACNTPAAARSIVKMAVSLYQVRFFDGKATKENRCFFIS